LSIRVGLAITGSFCTFSNVMEQIPILLNEGFDITPIMSQMSYSTDTRFGIAQDFIDAIEKLTGKKIIYTIKEAEPIGPKNLLDILVIAPCTGNTMGKLASGITDTSVTMAAKSHLRNQKPLVISISSNDALGASARNIGQLSNAKNVYFVPYKQDDFVNKPASMVANFNLILPTIYAALEGKQFQPIININ
jgi:dipicolinate synthase subunit B